jgi:hypothetical protein
MSDINFRYSDYLSPLHWRIITTLPNSAILNMIGGLTLRAASSDCDTSREAKRIAKLFSIQGEMLAVIRAMYRKPCLSRQPETVVVSVGQDCLDERMSNNPLLRDRQRMASRLCNRIDDLLDRVQGFLAVNERFFSDEHIRNFDRIINYFELMNEALQACLGRVETAPITSPERREVLFLYPHSTQVTPERLTDRMMESANSINQAVEKISPLRSRRALKFT